MSALLFLIGLVLGAAAVALALRRALRERAQAVEARASAVAERDAKALEAAALAAALEVERRSFDAKVVNAVKIASADALKETNAQFLDLAETKLQGSIAPLRESLAKVDVQVRTLEQARQQAFGALRQELETLRDGQDRLRTATGSLVTALRAPHVRGRWGEVQLRRVVEATGMLEFCDFVVQASVRDPDGSLLRPDLVVRLPGGKQVVLDAKVPLSAYLDACECEDEDERAVHLANHARQVREHIGKLAAKAYWRQFAPTPDFVIMFVPDESLLRAAQEHDRELVEYAWQANVVPASPTNLFTLLRTVAAAWQQETIAQSAREVHALGQELYDRLGTMAKHFQGVGKGLENAIAAYNRTVGTLESRVLVTGRRLQEHGIGGQPLAHVAPVEAGVRPLAAPELEAADPRELPAADAA